MSTILIVDDSAYARRTMRKTLESAHYTVVEAAGGMAAIESYFLQHPELVLLDLTMEDMDGLQVLKKLRELDASARIIVVSADVQSSTEKMVREAGGVAFLGKPVASETLLRTIDTVIQGAS
jgi:two-component system chemotaxis response regulator CheY